MSKSTTKVEAPETVTSAVELVAVDAAKLDTIAESIFDATRFVGDGDPKAVLVRAHAALVALRKGA